MFQNLSARILNVNNKRNNLVIVSKLENTYLVSNEGSHTLNINSTYSAHFLLHITLLEVRTSLQMTGIILVLCVCDITLRQQI